MTTDFSLKGVCFLLHWYCISYAGEESDFLGKYVCLGTIIVDDEKTKWKKLM